MKTYKLIIDKLIPYQTDIILDNAFLTIQADGIYKDNIRINQLSGLSFICEAQRVIQIFFTLQKHQQYGIKKLIIIGRGILTYDLFNSSISNQVTENCTISTISNPKRLFEMRIKILEDEQNRFYELPDSMYEEPQNMKQMSIEQKKDEQNQKVERIEDKRQDQLDSDKEKVRKYRLNKKIHHRKYKVLNEGTQNIKIYKNLQQQASQKYSIQNFTILQLDQPLFKLTISGNTPNKIIYQVTYQQNPSSNQLKSLKASIDKSIKQLYFQVLTLEDCLYTGQLLLPQLQQRESRRIIVQLFCQQQPTQIIKLVFNYLILENDQHEQKNMRFTPRIKKQQQFSQKRYYMDSLQKYNKPPIFFTPHLYGNNLTKRVHKRNSIINRINSRIQQNQGQSVQSMRLFQRKRFHTIETAYNLNISTPSKKVECGTQNKLQQESRLNSMNKLEQKSMLKSVNRLELEYGLNSVNKLEFIESGSQTDVRRNIKKIYNKTKKTINIKGINIKLYKNHQIFCDVSPLKQKIIKIYSDNGKVYNSYPTYSQFNLNWEFDDCKFIYSQFNNIYIELKFEHHQGIIGSAKLSQNQIRYLQSIYSDFSSYLTSNNEPIGKLRLQFVIQNQQKRNKPKRQSILNESEGQSYLSKYISAKQLNQKDKLDKNIRLPILQEKRTKKNKANERATRNKCKKNKKIGISIL